MVTQEKAFGEFGLKFKRVVAHLNMQIAEMDGEEKNS